MRTTGIISLLVILFLTTSFSAIDNPKAEDDGIQFENISFKQALEKAKKENKLVFMDAYTVWCGPCKMLARTTFRSKNVGDVFNKSFINIKIDMEKGEGIELARKYQINAYPTLLVINPEGKVVKRLLGAMDEKALLAGVDDVVKK